MQVQHSTQTTKPMNPALVDVMKAIDRVGHPDETMVRISEGVIEQKAAMALKGTTWQGNIHNYSF